MRFLAILLGLSLTTAGTVAAQQARIGVYNSPSFYACSFVPDLNIISTAYVVVRNTVPFQTIRFSAPVPNCNGIVWLGDTYWGDIVVPPAPGDSQTGAEVTFVSCTSSPQIVMAIQYMAMSASDPCVWVAEPHSADASGWIEMIDCEGYPAKGASTYVGNCTLIGEYLMIAGYRPTPVDGATGVPVNVLLDFVGPGNLLYFADHPLDVPIPGHSHWDDVIFYDGQGSIPTPFNPGTLSPNTTYYWQIVNDCGPCVHGDSAAGDMWSFTTGAAVATESSTWGQIKSLFRE